MRGASKQAATGQSKSGKSALDDRKDIENHLNPIPVWPLRSLVECVSEDWFLTQRSSDGLKEKGKRAN